MIHRTWRYLRVNVKSLLRLRGDPRHIARGIAVGAAMNFIPTVGLGLPVVYWAARLARGHATAALISTMSIKALFPVLYIFNYVVGVLVMERHFTYTLDWDEAARAGAVFLVGSGINFAAALAAIYCLALKAILARHARLAVLRSERAALQREDRRETERDD